MISSSKGLVKLFVIYQHHDPHHGLKPDFRQLEDKLFSRPSDHSEISNEFNLKFGNKMFGFFNVAIAKLYPASSESNLNLNLQLLGHCLAQTAFQNFKFEARELLQAF